MNDVEKIRQRIEERSQEKIRKRKQKRLQILAACVPMVLCISLGSVYAWQAGWLDSTQPEQIGAPESGIIAETYAASWQETVSMEVVTEVTPEDEMADNALTSGGVTMELSDSRIVTAYMDADLAHQVNTELQSIMTRSSMGAEANEVAVPEEVTAEIYRLKIFGKTICEYTLQSGMVTDETTGVTYRATQQQWENLCDLLNIPVS